jgi:hypothetical protein
MVRPGRHDRHGQRSPRMSGGPATGDAMQRPVGHYIPGPPYRVPTQHQPHQLTYQLLNGRDRVSQGGTDQLGFTGGDGGFGLSRGGGRERVVGWVGLLGSTTNWWTSSVVVWYFRSVIRSEAVLIGPICAGKSTVGELVGAALGVAHLDVDHAADRYYAEAGWSVARFDALRRRAGLLAAYRDGEPAMLSVLERVLADYHGCVFSLGAAHSHFTAPALFDRARRALEPFSCVVLLLPEPDPARSVAVLRERCREFGLPDWRDDECDLIERWVNDRCNHDLATLTVYTRGRTPEQTCGDVLTAVSGEIR